MADLFGSQPFFRPFVNSQSTSATQISRDTERNKKDFLLHGCPADYTEQTWLEMLIVKHTLIAAEQMKKEGDSISGMTDTEPLSAILRFR